MKPIRIHILEIEAALEAQALRASAEYWGAQVGVTWVGNSAQIVDLLSQEPPHELILICAHGDQRGVLLPPLADEVKAHFPFHDVISPDDFASFMRLEGNVVLCSGCVTGTEAMARAFLSCGARSFIAPANYPDGSPALLFELMFVFTFLKNGGDVQAAFDVANQQVEGDDRFRVFHELAEP